MQDQLRQNHFLVVGRAGMDLYADPPGTRTQEASRFSSALGAVLAILARPLIASLGNPKPQS